MSYIGSTEFLREVSKGNVPGHSLVTLPGQHEADVETIEWGDLSLVPNVVVLPNPGGIQLEVVSDSADDASGGTGARTVDIHYLDGTTGLDASETLTLNGTTPVNTVDIDIGNVQWMHVKTVGSGGVAAGNISLRNTAGSVTYEYIAEGGNQSLSARYTIPSDKKGYVIGWHVSGLKKRIDFQLRATCERASRGLLPGVFLFQDSEACEKSNSGWLPTCLGHFPPLCEIKISGRAVGSGGEASGSFTLMLVDN